MKIFIFKNIIINYFYTLILSTIICNLIRKGDFNRADIIVISYLMMLGIFFQAVNLILLFINKDNFYFLGKVLFILVPLIISTFLFFTGGFSKNYIIALIISFGLFQVLFYLKLKKYIIELESN